MQIALFFCISNQIYTLLYIIKELLLIGAVAKPQHTEKRREKEERLGRGVGFDGKPTPKAVGDESPEGNKKTITPIDDADMTFLKEGTIDLTCCILGFEHHGIMLVVVEQGGFHKAWTDVCEANWQMTYVCLLFQCLDIAVLKCFCRTIGRSCTKSFGTSDTGNTRYMSTFRTIGKIMKNGVDAMGETKGIRSKCSVLNGRIKSPILLADARGMEIEVDAIHFFDEREDSLRRIRRGDIDGRNMHLLWIGRAQGLKGLGATRRQAQCMTIAKHELCQFITHT